MSTLTDRTPMTDFDWFQKSGHLAIADVVYVEDIGVCSHQPDGVHEGNRMLDVNGNIHLVSNDRLFYATPEEQAGYWCTLGVS